MRFIHIYANVTYETDETKEVIYFFAILKTYLRKYCLILPINFKFVTTNKHVHTHTYTHLSIRMKFLSVPNLNLYYKELGNQDIFSLEMYPILFLFPTLQRTVLIRILFSTETYNLPLPME